MKQEGPARAAAAAAFAASAVATAWFARANGAPPSMDEAWYLEVSFRLWHALVRHGLLAFARAYASAFRFKAPLVSVLALPSYALFDLSYKAAVLANIPALALLAISLYGLGRRFFSPAAGALAATLGVTMPLTAALSRTFFVETWLAALTAAFLWRWAESEALSREGEAPVLGALLGLGLLTKVLFPLPIAGPTALTLWERRADLRSLERPLKVMAIVAALLALPWYGPNLVYVAGYTWAASFGSTARHYGTLNVLAPGVALPFLEHLASEGFSWWGTALATALLAILGRRAWGESGLRFAAAWALPPMAAGLLSVGKEPRICATGLPGLALGLAGMLDLAARGRRWRPLCLAAAAFPFLDMLALQSFGESLIPPFSLAGHSVVPSRTTYGGAPAPVVDLGTRGLVRWLGRRLPAGSIVAVGCEHPRLNANLLAAWAAQEDLPLSFVNYGHMEDHVERAVARLSEKDVTHILFVDGLDTRTLSPALLAVDSALRGLVERGRLPFRAMGRAPLGRGLTGEVWERTAPIRMLGALPPRRPER